MEEALLLGVVDSVAEGMAVTVCVEEREMVLDSTGRAVEVGVFERDRDTALVAVALEVRLELGVVEGEAWGLALVEGLTVGRVLGVWVREGRPERETVWEKEGEPEGRGVEDRVGALGVAVGVEAAEGVLEKDSLVGSAVPVVMVVAEALLVALDRAEVE